jgi:hypothetical protein
MWIIPPLKIMANCINYINNNLYENIYLNDNVLCIKVEDHLVKILLNDDHINNYINEYNIIEELKKSGNHNFITNNYKMLYIATT